MKITGLNIIPNAKAWDNGTRLLANFSVEFRGIALHECCLIREVNGDLFMTAPKGEAKHGGRVIQIFEPGLKAAITEAAHRAYVALGGEESAA